MTTPFDVKLNCSKTQLWMFNDRNDELGKSMYYYFQVNSMEQKKEMI